MNPYISSNWFTSQTLSGSKVLSDATLKTSTLWDTNTVDYFVNH